MDIRRLFHPLLLFAVVALQSCGLMIPVHAQTPTQWPVTGNLGGIAGSSTDTLQARLALVNCGNAFPTITGVTSAISRSTVLTADSNGNVSGAVWGNDALVCGGTASSLYQLVYLRNSIPAGQPQYYRIVSDFDLNTATPVAVTPPTTPLAAGLSCPTGQAMVGVLSNFTPVCQFIEGSQTIYATGPPSASSCTSTAQARYIQTDAAVGTGNEWLCFGAPGSANPTWHQQAAVGATPNLTIGTVTGLSPTTPATATLTGTPAAPILNLGIPQGAAATVAVGTVAGGSSAAVTNSGTANAAVLNFTLPTGPTGPTGPPATFRGLWSSGTTYAAGDLVSYGSPTSTYASLIASNVGHEPDTSPSDWALAASAGATGTAGASPQQLGSAAGLYQADIFSELGMQQHNLINYATYTDLNADINATNGTLVTGIGTYMHATGFIPVAGVTSVIANQDQVATGGGGLVCYDTTQTYLSTPVSGRISAGTAVTLPTGCAWIRTSFVGGPVSATTGLYTGSTLPGAFIPYGYVYPDAAYVASLHAVFGSTPASYELTQFDINLAASNAALPTLRNLINPANIVFGETYDHSCHIDSGNVHQPTCTYILGGGSPPPTISTSLFAFSGYIPVIAGNTYTVEGQGSPNNSTVYGSVFYDINFQPIDSSFVPTGSMTNNESFVAPANAAYFGLMLQNSAINTVMLIPGTTIVPQYIPFAQVPSTTQTRSPWYGLKVGVLGDSYCYANLWQQAVAAEHGMNLVYQDCRVGRPIYQINECYGGSFTGTNAGTGNATPTFGSPCNLVNNGTPGNTMAQDLAGLDLLLIELGTNDNYDSALGSPTDAPTNTGSSVFASLNYVMQGLLPILSPNTRVVWLTPIHVCQVSTGGWSSRDAAMGPISAAIEQIVNSYSIPVIDNYDNSGFNLITDPYLIGSDCIHPTGAGNLGSGQTVPGMVIYGRYPSRQLYNINPLK